MKAKGKRRAAGKASDFPKRKNKLGKGKRPAENATKISFKSRSIVLPSQLTRSHPLQPTGKRKLGLEALLRHLNHFKPSVRADGLTGLRELFLDHPHILVPNLAKLVSPVFGRLIDSDPSVRHSLLTLLGSLFSQLTPDLVRPHFSSIVAHLSCGLTHISEKTQLDSLKVFRLLLDRYPRLLCPHALHLLPLIAALVSRRTRSVAASSAVKVRKQVGLAHDPRSKLSKWTSRIDVFSLLSRFLETLLESVTERETAEFSAAGGSPPVVDVEGGRVLVERGGELVGVESDFCDFSRPVPCVMPLQRQGLPYKLAPPPSCDGAVTSPTGVTTLTSSDATPISVAMPTAEISVSLCGSEPVLSDVARFLEFSESLFSLLFDCWVECTLARSQRSKDMLVLMETVIHLLHLILKLSVHVGTRDLTVPLSTEKTSVVAGAVLRGKYSADFFKHFMTNFPLPTPSPSDNQYAQYLKMNLSLCHITTLLSRGVGHAHLPPLLAVCSFYGSLARIGTSLPPLSSQLTLDCCRLVTDTLPDLLAEVDGPHLPESNLDSLLGGVGDLYRSCHPQSSAKRCLIFCFRGLLRSSSVGSRVFTHLLLPWLECLPQLLVDLAQSSPLLSAFILNTLTSTSSLVPLPHLEQHLVSLLDSGVLTRLTSLSQRRFVELLWKVPALSPRLLGMVGEWAWSPGGCGHSSVASYLVEIVHHRLLRKKDSCCSTEPQMVTKYLIFMMGVLLGMAAGGGREDGGSLSQVAPTTAPISLLESERDINYRMKLINVVCECVRAAYFSDQVLELTAPTLQALLEGVCSMTVDRALAVLCFLYRLSSEESEIPRPLVPPLARLCYSALRSSRQPGCVVGVATERCSRVTNQLLRSSPVLLECLLQLCASEAERAVSEGVPVRELVECLLSLLDSTGLNSALRGCSTAVQAAAATVSGVLTDTEQNLRLRLSFSIKKFPSP